jgi:hypothetical protein
MIYQFFFINYLLSVCTVDVVRQAQKNAGAANQASAGSKGKAVAGERSVSQKIFIILLKLLDALGDQELNVQIDAAITSRVEAFEKPQSETKDEDAAANAAKKGGQKPQDDGAAKKR